MSMIKYNGLDNLTTEEQSELKRIVEKEFPKTERLVKDVESLGVDIKTHDKGGKRKLYMIDLRLISAKKVFNIKAKEADIKKSAYWDIAAASHKAMESLQTEATHAMKSDDSWNKKNTKDEMEKRRLNE